ALPGHGAADQRARRRRQAVPDDGVPEPDAWHLRGAGDDEAPLHAIDPIPERAPAGGRTLNHPLSKSSRREERHAVDADRGHDRLLLHSPARCGGPDGHLDARRQILEQDAAVIAPGVAIRILHDAGTDALPAHHLHRRIVDADASPVDYHDPDYPRLTSPG